jgi:hypothetical protein
VISGSEEQDMKVYVLTRSSLLAIQDGQMKIRSGENGRKVDPDPALLERCSKTVPKPSQFSSFGLALSEKQIPQIVENNESRTDAMEPLEATGVRPRQEAGL